MFRAVDCQGFGGGFSLGVVEAGFTLLGKREFPGGFGVPAMESNRHLLGDLWRAQSSEPDDWEPIEAQLVFGNPPCSAFSSLSTNIVAKGDTVRKDWRGADNPINDCMKALAWFGRRCNAETVIFESVQGAGKAGRPLMQYLRYRNEYKYLTHVFHNHLSCGGTAMRKRYFCVLSEKKFGVYRHGPNLATLASAIQDLEWIPMGGFPGHVTQANASTRRLAYLATYADWLPDEASGAPWGRLVEKYGEAEVRHSMETFNLTMPKRDAGDSMYAPRRWNYAKPARVVNGTTPSEAVHPTQPRVLTYREVARIMGYPDNWSCDAYIENGSKGASWFGKGIPVDSGRWIAQAAKASLMNEQDIHFGELIGENEYVINTTNDWKP